MPASATKRGCEAAHRVFLREGFRAATIGRWLLHGILFSVARRRLMDVKEAYSLRPRLVFHGAKIDGGEDEGQDQ